MCAQMTSVFTPPAVIQAELARIEEGVNDCVAKAEAYDRSVRLLSMLAASVS
jgi:hypothetical protein